MAKWNEKGAVEIVEIVTELIGWEVRRFNSSVASLEHPETGDVATVKFHPQPHIWVYVNGQLAFSGNPENVYKVEKE